MSDPVRPGRPEAAEVIWRWQGGDDRPRRIRSARRSALIRFVVASLAGGIFLFLHRPYAACVAGGVGAVGLVLAIASPLGAYAALDRGVTRASKLVGTLFTWLLLAPVFYLFFFPFGVLFRRGSRDPMRRAFDRDAITYWKRREHDRPNLDRPY